MSTGRKRTPSAVGLWQSLQASASPKPYCAFIVHAIFATPPVADKWMSCGNLRRSEEHTSELQSLMRISYAVFCLKKKNNHHTCLRLRTLHRHDRAAVTTHVDTLEQ